MHPASNRAGPGVISRASIGLTQARRLSYYTVATFFFIFHASAYTQKQAGMSAEANKLVIGPFFLLFLSPIVHVEPEVLSLGDRANSTCQARSSVQRRSVNGNKK